jgi:hypothetical protein
VTQEELWEKVGIFIHETLGIDEEDVRQEQLERVRRVKTGRRNISKDEVSVLFYERGVRDIVAKSAPKLADFFDQEGKPTAGIKLEVPAHLMGDFSILQSHGHDLRTKFGKDFKRHFKFDDARELIYLEVKLPGEDKWNKISAGLARSMKDETDREAEDELRRKLGARAQDRDGNPRHYATPYAGRGQTALARPRLAR